MPEPAVATPPSAPAGAAGAPRPPPAPTRAIPLSELPTGGPPGPPPRPGSARERMHQAMEKKAKPLGSAETPPTPVAGATTPPPEGASAQAAPKPGEGAEAAPPAPTPAGEKPAGTPPEPGKKEKPNPWKLYDAEKVAHAKTAKEFQDYRGAQPRQGEVESLSKRAEQAENLVKALSDEIRYHAYEKSPEFQKEFQAPYEAAFRRAMEDLAEITVTDPNTNQVRKLTGDDLAQLSFMTLAQAKEAATRLFPDYVDDIMAARKEIRTLWDKRQGALKEWKEKGSQREQESLSQRQKAHGELSTQVKTAWDKANEEALADETLGAYFKPRDRDQDWNTRLEAGYKLTKEAFAINLLDERLTPDQRREAVRHYAAVFNRSAGWAALRFDNDRLRQENTELQKELKGYKDTTPPAGGSEASSGIPPVGGKASERIKAGLRKYARPG